MKKSPKHKLITICKRNGYALSINDFDPLMYRLGKGGFGNVLLVKCLLNQTPYALKVLNKDKIRAIHGERFVQREKELNMEFRHKNIARMEGYFHDKNNGYFIMELCRLGDLKKLIDSEGELNKRLVRFYTIEIINALQYLHEKNVVHRDLKPENLMIDDTFHLKLIDFGAAKKIDPVAANDEYDRIFRPSDKKEKEKLKEKLN
jgi:serine/threonine protein kinase